MPRSKLPYMLLLVSIIAMGFTLNVAQAKTNHHKHHGKHSHKNWEQKAYQRLHAKLFKNITLTTDQESKIKADFDSYFQARRSFYKKHAAEIKDLHHQMKAARRAGDKQQLKELRKKWHALMSQGPKMKDTLDKMRTVLTADQQKQFQDNLNAMHHHHRHKNKHHKKHHGNG